MFRSCVLYHVIYISRISSLSTWTQCLLYMCYRLHGATFHQIKAKRSSISMPTKVLCASSVSLVSLEEQHQHFPTHRILTIHSTFLLVKAITIPFLTTTISIPSICSTLSLQTVFILMTSQEWELLTFGAGCNIWALHLANILWRNLGPIIIPPACLPTHCFI